MFDIALSSTPIIPLELLYHTDAISFLSIRSTSPFLISAIFQEIRHFWLYEDNRGYRIEDEPPTKIMFQNVRWYGERLIMSIHDKKKGCRWECYYRPKNKHLYSNGKLCVR